MYEHRRSLAALLAAHTDTPYVPEHHEFIERVADALADRYEQFPRWPESVRHFYACYFLNFQVGNGGFAGAAYNVPHLIPVAQAAFERFGRPKAAELCRRAVAKLPAELAEHAEKEFANGESIEAIFANFHYSSMSALDQELPDEFWADDALQELVERHCEDFASVDHLT